MSAPEIESAIARQRREKTKDILIEVGPIKVSKEAPTILALFLSVFSIFISVVTFSLGPQPRVAASPKMFRLIQNSCFSGEAYVAPAVTIGFANSSPDNNLLLNSDGATLSLGGKDQAYVTDLFMVKSSDPCTRDKDSRIDVFVVEKNMIVTKTVLYRSKIDMSNELHLEDIFSAGNGTEIKAVFTFSSLNSGWFSNLFGLDKITITCTGTLSEVILETIQQQRYADIQGACI